MAEWPGFGTRLRQRLVEVGYRQANGKPDVLGFSMKNSYVPMYVYKWLAGTTPDRHNLERLSKDLGKHPAWLLFGIEVDPVPANPRKRGARKAVGCLVAALGLTTLGWGSAQADARPVTESGHHSFLSEVLRRLRQAFPDRRFPDLQRCAA